jgi:flavin-dependent dehydrogenase
MKDIYDVVIVGARCAGAATARLLAAAGLDVLLLDRTRLPADTVSTHAILLGGIIQLRRWGLLEDVIATGATPIDAVDITSGDVSFTASVKHIGGVDRLYAPRRLVLDGLLADAAVAAGAELVTGATVHDVLRAPDGRVVGVTGAHGDAPFAVRARFVIGADGVRSTVARLVKAVGYREVPASNACHYAYFSGLEGSHYQFAFAPGVGAGAIPTDSGLTCVYAGVPSAQAGAFRQDIEAGFHDTVAAAHPGLSARLSTATRVTGFRGVRGLPGYFRRPHGRGWLLVGDAGYHRDPYSAHGMTDAFRDAELAARAVFEVVSDANETTAMNRYHQTRDLFGIPFADATARLASYDWDTEQVLAELAVMGEVGEAEARFLAAMPDLAQPYGDIAA